MSDDRGEQRSGQHAVADWFAETSTASMFFIEMQWIVIAREIAEGLDVSIGDRLHNRSIVAYFDFHGLFRRGPISISLCTLRVLCVCGNKRLGKLNTEALKFRPLAIVPAFLSQLNHTN